MGILNNVTKIVGYDTRPFRVLQFVGENSKQFLN